MQNTANPAASLTTNLKSLSDSLKELAAATRETATALDAMNCAAPGRWPDRFVILSRRLRYGFREAWFGGELLGYPRAVR